MKTAFYQALPVLLSLAAPAEAYDAFSEARIPSQFVLTGSHQTRLVLKGHFGLAFRDLEGPGGPRHDSTTDTATLGTRSPHFALGGARLAVRVELPNHLAGYSAFAFTEVGARLENGWLDYQRTLGAWQLHAELGLNVPIVAHDWETHRAPLAERVYWGSSEAHATLETAYDAGSTALHLGLSAAMMRPLESSPINDAAHRRGTISLLAYGPARPFSGNAPVWGVKLGLSWASGLVEGYGFWGRLAHEGGTDALRNRIAGFALLPDFRRDDPHQQDDTAWWAGVTARWNLWGFRLRMEAIRSRESLLSRHVLAAQLGFVWDRGPGTTPRTLEARIRTERYRIEGGGDALTENRALRSPDPSQAISWDHDVLTLALAARLYRHLLWVRAEHAFISEENGAAGLNRPHVPLANNETTLDLELRF